MTTDKVKSEMVSKVLRAVQGHEVGAGLNVITTALIILTRAADISDSEALASIKKIYALAPAIPEGLITLDAPRKEPSS